MRILYIMPGVVSRGGHGSAEMERRRGVLDQWADPNCEVSITDLDEGPHSIESIAEEYLSVPGLLRCVKKAEEDGYHAVIDGCYTDPGIDACREIVDIPVLGPGECSMLVAASVSHRFSIITALEGLVRPLERLAKTVGIDAKFASVRQAGVPVLDLGIEPELSYRRVFDNARVCLAEDGADTLILGCMSMAFLGISERLQSELGVPVVNPAQVTLKFAEMLVHAKLTSSRIAYPSPSKDLSLKPG